MLKTSSALIRTFLSASFMGILSTFVQSVLFWKNITKPDELIFVILWGIFTSCFLAFLLCLLMLLLSFLDAKKIQENNFRMLIERYLPFFVIPMGIVFLLNFLLNEIGEPYYVVRFFLLNAYLLSTTGLIVFLRKLKSAS